MKDRESLCVFLDEEGGKKVKSHRGISFLSAQESCPRSVLSLTFPVSPSQAGQLGRGRTLQTMVVTGAACPCGLRFLRERFANCP